MYKYLLCALIASLFTHEAKCQNSDTVVTYYKYFGAQTGRINNIDSADYIRMTYPDSVKNLGNVKEYYKNGRIKFVGKYAKVNDVGYNSEGNALILDGTCVSFYPNGKKQKVVTYTDGKKKGFEFYFKKDGHVCYVEKWIEEFSTSYSNTQLYWECYDENGNKICEDGNGRWVVYNDDFTRVLLSGQVKKGILDGQWSGATLQDDSVKYIINYKAGKFLSGIGYDKSGTSYPFKTIKRTANYNGKSLITFVEILKNHLKVPRDENGKKINIDSVRITFIIEKDGLLDHLEVLGNTNPALKNALDIATAECGKWVPSKFCGIPFRTKMMLPLKIKEGYDGNLYVKEIGVQGQVLDFNKSGELLNYQIE
jgi:hypothetical protein